MKNILFTLIFLFSLTSFSQYVSPNQNKVNVTVKQEQTIGQQIAQGRQAAAA